MTSDGDDAVVYELLGAPSLLYRHPLENTTVARPWGMEAHEARYLHGTQQQVAGVRARWHHAVDHSFRINYEPRKKKKKRRRVGEKSVAADGKDSTKASAPENAEADHTKQSGDEQDGDALDSLENERQSEEETETDELDDEFHKMHLGRNEIQAKSGYKSDESESDTDAQGRRKALSDDETDMDKEVPPVNEVGQQKKTSSFSRDHEGGAELTTAPRSKRKKRPLLDPEFLKTRTDPTVLAARQHVLRGEEAKVLTRSYQQYDHPYIPVSESKQKPKGKAKLSREARRKSREMHVDRLNADPAYLAPVDYQSLHYCLNEDKSATAEEKKLTKSKHRRKMFPIDAASPDSPLMYGNCLVCTPCPCNACSSGIGEKDDEHRNDSNENARHGWCLIHPTGESLSSVCVSNLLLPHGSTLSASTKKEVKRSTEKYRQELDVGETILQIVPCGDGRIRNASSDGKEGMFVVRSANYCTVIRVETHRRKNEEASSCSGKYHIEEVTRIDLRSLSRSFPSYKPLDVATHPRYGNKLSNPKFATLGRSRTEQCNTIHHISLRDTPLIEEHNIPSLKSISGIDFTSTHPMTLWASAESYVRPKLVTEIYSKKPLLGHGHSLYTIDLRSNDATFQWSPSAEEMVVEGVHSISAIMTDWKREHTVWVSSSSAGKTWEIDARMPCQAVNTFSLAYVSDEGRTVFPILGLHGGGSILTQPVGLSSPVLGVDKTPGSFAFRVYQRPEFRPRFQTSSLECMACPGLSSRVSRSECSIARSSCFPLPDVSESVFTCGLAAFRTNTTDFMSQDVIDSLGYNKAPESVLCTLSMTNKGDLYSHSLLECRSDEESRSKTLPGLPLGCTAVAVPAANNPPGEVQEEEPRLARPKSKTNGGWNFPLSLTNQFPLSTSELAPMSVKSRKECRPFTTVRLEHIPTYRTRPRATAPLDGEEIPVNQALQLPPEYATAAHREVVRLKDCFSSNRKSVVEDRGVRKEALRSDMSAELFNTVGNLWDEDEDIKNHMATKTVKRNPGQSNLYSANI